MTPAKPTVLLADDNANNAELIRMSFRKAGYDNPIQGFCRGEEAIEYLKGEGEYSDRAKFPLPALLLLDTRMPGLSGWDVLKWVRQQSQFASLPIVVFTGSEYPGDRQKAEDLGANAYLVKPQTFVEFTNAVKKIADFWLRNGLPAFSG